MKKRELNLDLLRILASLMVVSVHVNVLPENNFNVSSPMWGIYNFWHMMLRGAVPLFFMISGKLFLERKDELDIKKFFTRNILKLILIYAVWTTLYAVEQVGVKEIFTSEGMCAFWICAADTKYHLWFLPAMINVYLILPVLLCIVRYQDGKYLKYVVGIFVWFQIVVHTISLFFADNIVVCKILGKFNFEISGYAGYFLLGYYLSTLNLEKIKTRYLAIATFLVIFANAEFNTLYNRMLDEPSYILCESFTVFTFMEVVLLFLLFLKLPKTYPAPIGKVITYLSGSTLGVYLIHVYVIEHLRDWYGITVFSFPYVVGVPIMTAIVVGVSLVIIGIIRLVPIVNRWLV